MKKIKIAVLLLVATSALGYSGGATDNYEWNETYEDAEHSLTLMVKENTTDIKFAEREKYAIWAEMEEFVASKGLKLGFEIIQDDQYQTTIQTRFAAGSDMPEYMVISGLTNAEQVEQIDSGMFLPINDFIANGDGTSKAFFEEYDWALKNSTYSDGNVYWLPAVQYTDYEGKPATTAIQLMIRNDWLKKIGKTAADIVTIDDFYMALKEMQAADVNGNGIADEQYINNIGSFAQGLAPSFGISHDLWSLNMQTGEVQSGWEMPGAKDYFKFMQKLFAEGLISQEVVGAKNDTITTMKSNNQASVVVQYLLDNSVDTTYVAGSVDLGVEHVSIGPLDPMNDALTPIMTVEPAFLAGWSRAAFTKYLKDPVAAAILLDALYSDKHEEILSWGTKGITYEEDADGVRHWSGVAADGTGIENAPTTGVAMGRWLWNNNVFPQVRFASRAGELHPNNGVPELNRQYQIAVFEYPNTMPLGNSNYSAVPLLEEIEVLNEYTTNFTTVSDELAAKLYKGELDVDADWDSIIEQLNAVGMQELLAVHSAASERYRR